MSHVICCWTLKHAPMSLQMSTLRCLFSCWSVRDGSETLFCPQHYSSFPHLSGMSQGKWPLYEYGWLFFLEKYMNPAESCPVVLALLFCRGLSRFPHFSLHSNASVPLVMFRYCLLNGLSAGSWSLLEVLLSPSVKLSHFARLCRGRAPAPSCSSEWGE